MRHWLLSGNSIILPYRLYDRMLYSYRDVPQGKESLRMDSSRSRWRILSSPGWHRAAAGRRRLECLRAARCLGYILLIRQSSSYPPPPPFIWNRVTPAPPTSQQAYTAGMSVLNICGNRPPANVTTTTLTWLVAGPTYGVVLARATCSQDKDDVHEGIDLLPLALDKACAVGLPRLGNRGWFGRNNAPRRREYRIDGVSDSIVAVAAT